jgi:hypothetical protein
MARWGGRSKWNIRRLALVNGQVLLDRVNFLGSGGCLGSKIEAL